MTDFKPQVLDIVQHYRAFGFFSEYGEEADEEVAAKLLSKLISAVYKGGLADADVLSLDALRVIQLEEASDASERSKHEDAVVKKALTTIQKREGEPVLLERLDGRRVLTILTVPEQVTLRRERHLSIWHSISGTSTFVRLGFERLPLFRWAFYGRTPFRTATFGYGLADLSELLSEVSISRQIASDLLASIEAVSGASDRSLGQIFKAALTPSPPDGSISFAEPLICFSSEQVQSPNLVQEPLNFQVSKNVLVPAAVRTLLDSFPIDVSLSTKTLGLASLKIITVGAPPEEPLAHYLWVHGLISSFVMSHLHSIVSGTLALHDSARDRGNTAVTRWPGFNWDSDGNRCWIWSESYEFVVTLFDYLVADEVNKILKTQFAASTDETSLNLWTDGLHEFLVASTLERIETHCPEIKMISHINENNLEEHSRKYFEDLRMYVVKSLNGGT